MGRSIVDGIFAEPLLPKVESGLAMMDRVDAFNKRRFIFK